GPVPEACCAPMDDSSTTCGTCSAASVSTWRCVSRLRSAMKSCAVRSGGEIRNTPAAPRTARANAVWSARSATKTSAPSACKRSALAASRTTTRTFFPAPSSVSAATEPVCPVAPVMTNILDTSCLKDILEPQRRCGQCNVGSIIMHMLHDRNLSAIDLNLLVILRALLNERHVTRAAQRIGLSQSATSHALARLRELLGDPLLVRSGRALTLTP